MIEFLPETDAPDESPELQMLRGALDSYHDRFGPHHPLVLEVVERLAMALWREDEAGSALELLDEAIESLPESADSQRADLLDLVWKIFFQQGRFEPAGRILMEVHACRLRAGGPFHPDALAAEGDLAIVFHQLGRREEAEALNRSALASAREHLGPKDRVTCVIAWNAVLAAEGRNDLKSACRIAVESLLWLLNEDPSSLEADLVEIREWLTARFCSDTLPVC